jgi:hypothetical protein
MVTTIPQRELRNDAHGCDVLPGDVGLVSQQPRRDGLDGLADLQEPNPDGVEHQPV